MHEVTASAVQVPSGAEVFVGESEQIFETPNEDNRRKPPGTSDQGYRED